MVLPFALAFGVAMVLGMMIAPIAWALACGAACAALYMWNTRPPVRPASADGEPPPGPGASIFAALVTYAGLLILMSLVGGAGYLFGRFFTWARLDT